MYKRQELTLPTCVISLFARLDSQRLYSLKSKVVVGLSYSCLLYTSTQEYIAETLGNKRAAQKLVASILKAISLLEENPMMGVSMKAKFEIKTSIRFFVVAKHLVFYEIIEDNMLSILHVLDGRQDYLAILFG